MKTKLFTAFTISVSISFSVTAQSMYQKSFAGGNQDYIGKSLVQTSDGGFAIAGHINQVFFQGTSAYLLKLNSNGDTLWTREFSSTVGNCTGTSVCQSSDGGIVVAGALNNGSDDDIYLSKTNSNGSLLWSKTFGGINNEDGYAVQSTSDGGIIIGGATNSFGAGNYDAYLIKTDGNGNALWTKTFGGTNADYCKAMRQTTDGGFIFTGVTQSFSDTISFLTKTDATGNLQWTKTYGSSSYSCAGNSVQQTSDGGYIITGAIKAGGTMKKDAIFLVKTNSIGDTLWTKKYAGDWAKYHLCVGAMPSESYSVEQTNDAGFILAGNALDSCIGILSLLIKTNSSGNIQWTNTFATNLGAQGFSVHQTNDGGFISAGSSGDNNSTGGINAYVIKTNSSGQSGCNELNTQTIVSSSKMTVKNPVMQVSSGGAGANVTTQVVSGGGEMILCNTATEVNDASTPFSMTIEVYPNPSEGIFTIKSENEKLNSIEIINVLGENIYKSSISKSETLIDISSVPKGIYFIRLISNTEIVSEKIIIE